MRFFTPDLYRQFNSADDAEVERASDLWEDAVARYEARLTELEERLNGSARAILALAFHDAEILAQQETAEPATPSGAANWPKSLFLAVKPENEESILCLTYILWDDVRSTFEETWPFPRDNPTWLYDEVDVAESQDGAFVHRILRGDGIVLEVPFVSVMVNRVPLAAVSHSSTAVSKTA